MLSFGKSFRTNKDKEVIKFGSENLYIGGNYLKNSSKGREWVHLQGNRRENQDDPGNQGHSKS